MTLEILLAAGDEIENAFLYYESQMPGLGFQFLAAVTEGYGRILSNPQAWAAVSGRRHTFHRCLLKRFPYGIIYVRKGDVLTVVAVMHLSRKPGYWRKQGRGGKKGG